MQSKSDLPVSKSSNKITKVGIVGAGLVGRSWALVFARGGCDVKIFDFIPETSASSLEYIRKVSTDLLQAGLLGNCKSVEDLMARITVCKTLKEALEEAEWVQECVPENKDHKKQAFEEMEKHATKTAILASSTSAIPSSAFTSHLDSRERCLVAHPVNPPHLIPLVEVVPHPHTLPTVVTQARDFLSKIGQSPIVVKKELDSFILNRLQGALLNEAFRLIEEDAISPEDLDKTLKDGLGLRWSFMGPFETIDLNAPGGVEDYCNRYSSNMHTLALQQSKDPHPWTKSAIQAVTEARRAVLPLDSLPQRAQWRDLHLQRILQAKLLHNSSTSTIATTTTTTGTATTAPGTSKEPSSTE